jgi:type II secretory pathway pseudopilin PulG
MRLAERRHGRRLLRRGEEGFGLVDLMMATVIMAILLGSVTYVLANALVDTGYAKQRATALQLANQTVEELRALPWSTVEQGLGPGDLSSDGNIYQSASCFAGQPLDIAGYSGSGTGSGCGPQPSWSDPSCLNNSGLPAPPAVGALASPAPLDPHQACYKVGGTSYGVSTYVTWVTGVAAPPVTATVVVSWNHPLRSGLEQRVVTTTQISNCPVGEANCNAQ